MVAHVSALKIIETTNDWKSVTCLTLIVCIFKIIRRPTETTHQQRMDGSESRGCLTCCWRVASTATRLR